MTRPYACKGCGATGVKLWRDYGTPFHWDLWCVDCACAKTGGEYSSETIDPALIQEDGARVTYTHYFDKTTRLGLLSVKGAVDEDSYVPSIEKRVETSDSIGWRVPAIQSQDDPDVYWGYSSWTEERKGDWDAWAALPLRAKATVDA